MFHSQVKWIKVLSASLGVWASATVGFYNKPILLTPISPTQHSTTNTAETLQVEVVALKWGSVPSFVRPSWSSQAATVNRKKSSDLQRDLRKVYCNYNTIGHNITKQKRKCISKKYTLNLIHSVIIYVYTYIHLLALRKLTNNQRVSWHRAHGRQPCVDHQTWQHTVFVSRKASPGFACAIQKLLCSNAWSDKEVNSSLKRLPYLYFTSNS